MRLRVVMLVIPLVQKRNAMTCLGTEGAIKSGRCFFSSNGLSYRGWELFLITFSPLRFAPICFFSGFVIFFAAPASHALASYTSLSVTGGRRWRRIYIWGRGQYLHIV